MTKCKKCSLTAAFGSIFGEPVHCRRHRGATEISTMFKCQMPECKTATEEFMVCDLHAKEVLPDKFDEILENSHIEEKKMPEPTPIFSPEILATPIDILELGASMPKVVGKSIAGPPSQGQNFVTAINDKLNDLPRLLMQALAAEYKITDKFEPKIIYINIIATASIVLHMSSSRDDHADVKRVEIGIRGLAKDAVLPYMKPLGFTLVNQNIRTWKEHFKHSDAPPMGEHIFTLLFHKTF